MLEIQSMYGIDQEVCLVLHFKGHFECMVTRFHLHCYLRATFVVLVHRILLGVVLAKFGLVAILLGRY